MEKHWKGYSYVQLLSRSGRSPAPFLLTFSKVIWSQSNPIWCTVGLFKALHHNIIAESYCSHHLLVFLKNMSTYCVFPLTAWRCTKILKSLMDILRQSILRKNATTRRVYIFGIIWMSSYRMIVVKIYFRFDIPPLLVLLSKLSPRTDSEFNF